MARHPAGMISSASTTPLFARPVAHDFAQQAVVSDDARTRTADHAAANAKPTPTGAASATSRVQLIAKLASVENQTSPHATQAAKEHGHSDTQPSEAEERAEQKLKQIDTKVRAHERAHSAAGGAYAGTPSYKFTEGPNGKRYAVSGEVQIDASPVRDNPEETIRKMEVVISAALAPADPSSQDLAVARQAQTTRAQAQAAINKKHEAEREENSTRETGSEDPSGETDTDKTSASARYEAQVAYTGGPVVDNGAVATEIFSALLA